MVVVIIKTVECGQSRLHRNGDIQKAKLKGVATIALRRRGCEPTEGAESNLLIARGATSGASSRVGASLESRHEPKQLPGIFIVAVTYVEIVGYVEPVVLHHPDWILVGEHRVGDR